MVQFLNSLEVPPDRDGEFLRLFVEVNEYMAAKPGYLGHRMHRSLNADVRYRFVNYVEWESSEHWRAAHDAGFRTFVSQPDWTPFPSMPVLYDVVHAGGAGA